MPEEARTVHRTANGVPVLTYFAESAGGRPMAYAIEVIGAGDKGMARAAEAIRADMSGWIVSGPAALADQLVRAGAHVRRRFHFMRRPLTAELPSAWSISDLGPGRREVPCARDPQDLFGAWHAAYSAAGHPDRHPGSGHDLLTEQLIPLLSGAVGPLLPWSRLVVDPDDRVVAGVVVIDNGNLGPWVGEVFRDPGPGYAGLGTALLQRVLVAGAQAHAREVGLSVTDGNPARTVYERLGFRTTGSWVTLDVP
jgi:GNAT superfamily N-acetyltransferase